MGESIVARQLLVGGLVPQDAGRGIARVSRDVMADLDMESGDIVQIVGKRTTVAKVMPAYQNDAEDIVRIDGNTRANAGAGIDERVEVEKADAEPAKRITVAVSQYISLQGGESFLKRVLYSRPVVKGDSIRIGLLGRPFVFVVTETKPSGPVVVGDDTELVIRDEPITEEDLRGERTELPGSTYEDVGGLEDELEQIREMIELPLRHPELFQRLGIAPPKGVLLHGPPGTGKTLIAKAVANEVDASFYSISGPEIMSKYYGESEQQLRKVFEDATEDAPAVIFIDELDSIAPSRDQTSGETERRVVAQLLTLMDGLDERENVIVIAATNRVNAIDSALRRGGRFDREIEIGVPSKNGRHEVLQIHTRGMPLTDDVDLEALASQTHGFVGADLETLAKEAAMNALRRLRAEIDLDVDVIPTDVLDELQVTDADFEAALAATTPSAMREVFVEVPTVTYEDVGGLDAVKRELVRTVEWPLAYPSLFDRLHTDPPRGILMYGPPGTGKTLLAKAVANASGVNFISVKGPELLDKYVGESERAVREVFQRARQNAPTVVFFDEIDAIAPERGGSFDSRVTERVVSQLLTELDGIEELRNVVVVGATNRPDILDRALLRPGRLEKLVYVPTPDQEARRAIFEVHARGVPLADDVSLDQLAGETDRYTGSDIEAIIREAALLSMDQYLSELPDASPSAVAEVEDELVVETAHFRAALEKVTPSVTDEMRESYDMLAEELGGRAQEDMDDSGLGFQ